MAKVPEVTLADYKDWVRRYSINCTIPDNELEAALKRANEIAQDIEDRREKNRSLTNGNK